MRLTYVPNPPIPANDEEAKIIDQTLERRGEEGLIPLDLTLLHSPPITAGWNSFLGAIRTKTSIPADIRETAICRVAVVNQAHFEWAQHSPLALQAGVTREGLKSILNGSVDGLTEQQIAVMNFATASTRELRVPDAVFDRLRQYYDEKEIVEIVATVAAYNCVSKFLVALDVAEGNTINVVELSLTRIRRRGELGPRRENIIWNGITSPNYAHKPHTPFGVFAKVLARDIRH